MKTSKLYFTFFFSLIACSLHAQLSTVPDVIKTKFSLMNTHNIEKMSALYMDSASIQSTGFDEIEKGPMGIKNIYSRYFKSSPDLSYEITGIIYKDTAAVVQYTSKGTMTTLEESVPAYMRGKKYELKNCTIFTIFHGKIAKEITYFDQVSFLKQVGFFEKHD